MAWNGSGTFSRITTTVSPAVGGTTIDVADQNTYTADVTAGINACLAKNGENAATANLDMGGFRHRNVANGSALTDYASLDQVQRGAYNYAVDAGVADAYAVTPFPPPIAYTAGQTIKFKALNANTGACTINVTGASGALGAKNIKTHDIDDPPANAILAGGVYTVIYDGTQFQLQGNIDLDVGFSVYDTASAPSTNTWTQIAWTTETRDPGNNFASNAYTCPTDGVYQFNAGLTYASMADGGGPTEIALYVDGVLHRATAGQYNNTGGVATLCVQISVCDFFSANEVISIWTRHQGAATEDFLGTDGYNYFDGTRINLG